MADLWNVPVSGSSVAVWHAGEGPPLVLVHGSLADHHALDKLAAALSRAFSTYALDRRGFGSSPETDDYSFARELDDIAKVVDAVATRAGPVALFGHSWGASCALCAAGLTHNAGHLVLYEPSLGLSYPDGLIDRLQAHIDAGDVDAAISVILTDLAGLTPDEVEAAHNGDNWDTQLATAHTIVREARVEAAWKHEDGEFNAIAVPTLFLAGTETPADLAAQTISCADRVAGSRVVELVGHGHFAHETDPAMVAAIISNFVSRAPSSQRLPGR